MIRIAKTENGMVRGIEAADPRITSFKGIPFAAPPVGENRWRAPQPAADWEGVRDASRFAPISVQDTPGLGTDIYCKEWHVDPEIAIDEDCLYLNVWTSARTPDEKQPVLVWFFGGGLQWGYPSEMEFDAERLARRGIVVVTVNYRLNVFGFLAHPQLTAQQPDAPSNFGSLDQQAGLKWTIRNIRAFGGDPENITIAGQSAGGGSVLNQMASPSSIGLFQKATIMSGMIRSPYEDGGIGNAKSLAEAEKEGEDFFAFLGVKSLEEARALDAFEIRAKYAEYAQSHPRMFSIVDGKFCVGNPLEVIWANKGAQVPVMAGNTGDEFPSFIMAASEEELREKAEARFGEHADEFLELVRSLNASNGNIHAAISGIECTVKTVFLQKEKNDGVPCYYYRFDVDIPGEDNPGTFHSVDLWFFFETLAKCWRPFTGKHYDIARQISNYWVNFIKSGDPNGLDIDGTQMPVWESYTAANPAEMVFTVDGAKPGPQEENSLIPFLMKRMKEQFDRSAH